MELERVTKFQNNLLKWYDENARVLPWRDAPSPYRVWISEVMLQQTRVNAVKPYFERFIKEASNVEDLANLSEDRLLKLWEGLGYYSRARNLQKAAKILIEKFNSQLPSDVKSLQSLPGIGPYTAGAISSIAFEQRVSAVDGNVLRVMARITANQGNILDSKIKKEIEETVYEILPGKRVGDFNQALMELGATICIPHGTPKCLECPLQDICQGYQQGIVESIPVKTKKRKRKIEQRTVFILKHPRGIALRKRPNKGLLSNMWEFPNVKGHLSYKQCEEKIQEWGISAEKIIPLNSAKHIFTHIEWHMVGYFILVDNDAESLEGTWVTKDQIKKDYSIPSAFKDYLKYLFREEKEDRQVSFLPNKR